MIKQIMDNEDNNCRKPRISFDIDILLDGSICFGDIPEELFPLLTDIFPNDPQTERALKALQDLERESDYWIS